MEAIEERFDIINSAFERHGKIDPKYVKMSAKGTFTL